MESFIETEEVSEAEQSKTKGNSPEPESTPAFEFGLAVAGLTTARLSSAGHKPHNMDRTIVHKLQPDGTKTQSVNLNLMIQYYKSKRRFEFNLKRAG